MSGSAIKTWADVEAAAETCPVLRNLVDVVRAGLLTREAALINIVLFLSQERARMVQLEIERRSLELPKSFTINR